MKKFALLLGVILAAGYTSPVAAAEFKFHGDLNNRFMAYTDQAGMWGKSESISGKPIDKDGIGESWGEIKYRFWVEAATNDGKIKGVYAIEIGAVRFGNGAGIGGSTRTGGGNFSGDGINVETRWAYTDFQLPGVESKARVSIGLIPFKVNSFLWEETAMGVQLKGTAGPADYTLAWVRGNENFNNNTNDTLFRDLDALLGRVDLKPMKGTNAGLFALYERRHPGTNGREAFVPAAQYQVKLLKNVNFNLYNLGTDGSMAVPTGFGSAFVNWDLIYQTGSLEDNTSRKQDIDAFLAHADLGANFGKARLTYTVWYASGDDNNGDDKIKNYMSTDVDRADSIIFFESLTDDNYFTEAPHILDKGLFFNKLALGYKPSNKLTVGGAVLYLQTAKDLAIGGGKKDKSLGTEIDASLSYMLFPDTELAVNVGYLFAGDGMDAFEKVPDGKSDANVFVSNARLRYKF